MRQTHIRPQARGPEPIGVGIALSILATLTAFWAAVVWGAGHMAGWW